MTIRSIQICFACLLVVCRTALAQGADPIRVNVGPAGQQSTNTFAGTNLYQSTPGISSDGRYVSFDSGATDLLSLSTEGYHVFLRDVATGTTELISQTSSGVEVPGSGGPMSSDGRFVLFSSSHIDNFTFSTQLYLRDRQAGTTTLVSGPPGGGEPNQSFESPAYRIGALSSDARYTLFSSLAGNLITPNESNQTSRDLFVFDRNTASTRRVVAVTPNTSNSFFDFTISGDGNIVAFVTDDPNIVPGDQNSAIDLFLLDLSSGVTTKAFSHSSGAGVDIKYLSLSADGRYLAFVTTIPIDARHTDPNGQVYVFDRAQGTTTLVSVGLGGVIADNLSSDCSISADGQLIAFSSPASNILPNSLGGQVFLTRWQTGETILLSSTAAGETGNGSSLLATISAEGGFAAVLSFASNLVANDTNVDADYFRVSSDKCPTDSTKLSPGQCGCGIPDVDANSNGIADCAEVLTPATRLTLPPTVAVQGRTAIVTLQKFSSAILTTAASRIIERASKRPQKLTVQYEITLMKVGAPKRQRIQRVTKRNQETFRKLAPGQYVVSYQAFGVKGTKRVIKTNVSPRASFQIG